MATNKPKIIKDESEIAKENELLKSELSKLTLMVESLMSKNDKVLNQVISTESEEWNEIPMHKAIKVMSLFEGGLNLKTSNDGNAQVFRFEKVGQIFPILYSDLSKVIANQRNFFEEGYCTILDKDVIKAHYLEEFYKKIIDGKTINNILDYEDKKIEEIFSNTTKIIQQSIVDIIIKKIINNDYVDKNKVTILSKIYGEDIFEMAYKMR